MRKNFLMSLSLLVAFLALPNVSSAHPVAYAGSNSIMTWNNKEMSEWMYAHSFTSHYALAARYFRNDTRDGEREFYIPQFNFLLKRWNELESQGNVYLSIGHGGEVVGTSFKDTSLLDFEADWESREYYISFKQEALLANRDSSLNIYTTRLRGGFAPYLANFNELNSWFILQLEKSNKSKMEYTITPLIRLFYKNVLVETGMNQKGDAQLNFMVHF
jgi:hypothetical protein